MANIIFALGVGIRPEGLIKRLSVNEFSVNCRSLDRTSRDQNKAICTFLVSDFQTLLNSDEREFLKNNPDVKDIIFLNPDFDEFIDFKNFMIKEYPNYNYFLLDESYFDVNDDALLEKYSEEQIEMFEYFCQAMLVRLQHTRFLQKNELLVSENKHLKEVCLYYEKASSVFARNLKYLVAGGVQESKEDRNYLLDKCIFSSNKRKLKFNALPLLFLLIFRSVTLFITAMIFLPFLLIATLLRFCPGYSLLQKIFYNSLLKNFRSQVMALSIESSVVDILKTLPKQKSLYEIKKKAS